MKAVNESPYHGREPLSAVEQQTYELSRRSRAGRHGRRRRSLVATDFVYAERKGGYCWRSRIQQTGSTSFFSAGLCPHFFQRVFHMPEIGLVSCRSRPVTAASGRRHSLRHCARRNGSTTLVVPIDAHLSLTIQCFHMCHCRTIFEETNPPMSSSVYFRRLARRTSRCRCPCRGRSLALVPRAGKHERTPGAAPCREEDGVRTSTLLTAPSISIETTRRRSRDRMASPRPASLRSGRRCATTANDAGSHNFAAALEPVLREIPCSAATMGPSMRAIVSRHDCVAPCGRSQ